MQGHPATFYLGFPYLSPPCLRLLSLLDKASKLSSEDFKTIRQVKDSLGRQSYGILAWGLILKAHPDAIPTPQACHDAAIHLLSLMDVSESEGDDDLIKARTSTIKQWAPSHRNNPFLRVFHLLVARADALFQLAADENYFHRISQPPQASQATRLVEVWITCSGPVYPMILFMTRDTLHICI